MSLSSVTEHESEVAQRPPFAVAGADHDLTVIVPAYNEEQRLSWALGQLTAFLDHWGVDYRILVADDGSTDATGTLACAFGPRCSTLRATPHRGKGRAVREAMLRATGRVLAFTDADLPFELSALRVGYHSIARGGCRVVFGARDIEGARHLAPRRWARRLATFAFRQIVRRLISREVTDTQCGLKLFERRAALEIFGRSTIDGFAFDTEVVLLTHRLGLPFRRVPVTLVNEFASTLSLVRNVLPMLSDVLRLWLRDRLGRGVPAPQFLVEPAKQHPPEDEAKIAA